MVVSIAIDNNVEDIEVSEIFSEQQVDTSIHCIRIGTLQQFINFKQAEKLCEALESALYDEPTYRQLKNENISLMNEIDRLKSGEYIPETYDLDGIAK